MKCSAAQEVWEGLSCDRSKELLLQAAPNNHGKRPEGATTSCRQWLPFNRCSDAAGGKPTRTKWHIHSGLWTLVNVTLQMMGSLELAKWLIRFGPVTNVIGPFESDRHKVCPITFHILPPLYKCLIWALHQMDRTSITKIWEPSRLTWFIIKCMWCQMCRQTYYSLACVHMSPLSGAWPA